MVNHVSTYCDAAAAALARGVPYLDHARRWVRSNPDQALAIAEEIGSFPASDPDLRALQVAFAESLGAPRQGGVR